MLAWTSVKQFPAKLIDKHNFQKNNKTHRIRFAANSLICTAEFAEKVIRLHIYLADECIRFNKYYTWKASWSEWNTKKTKLNIRIWWNFARFLKFRNRWVLFPERKIQNVVIGMRCIKRTCSTEFKLYVKITYFCSFKFDFISKWTER